LHDEINTLQLELGQIEERNAILVKDNAKLLQRWLDAKQEEVNKMNEVNEFYQDMRSRRETAPKPGTESPTDQAEPKLNHKPSMSGKEEANGATTMATAKTTDGTTSQEETLRTPNG
jgi:autophagy-related protein 16-1